MADWFSIKEETWRPLRNEGRGGGRQGKQGETPCRVVITNATRTWNMRSNKSHFAIAFGGEFHDENKTASRVFGNLAAIHVERGSPCFNLRTNWNRKQSREAYTCRWNLSLMNCFSSTSNLKGLTMKYISSPKRIRVDRRLIVLYIFYLFIYLFYCIREHFIRFIEV